MQKSMMSELKRARMKFRPTLPEIYKNGPGAVLPVSGKLTGSIADQEMVRKLFPRTYGMPLVTFSRAKNPVASKKIVKVGAVLSGGQAPGGHNVIAGLFDGLKKANPENKLIGFLGGQSGILENKWKEITARLMDEYRNTGGFDIIGSGRTSIESPEQFELAKKTLLGNNIDALVVIGGDDSNTNAALMAEYFKNEGVDFSVIGVPKTIDGDLKSEQIEASFGFDTATKIYSELAGNICCDVNSARKHWHFVRLMGRSASHIALEVAFKTQPNITLIGEEALAKNMTLAQIVESIAEVVSRRAGEKKDFGVAIIPEGLIEFIPEMKKLISNLNEILAENEGKLSSLPHIDDKKKLVYSKLPARSSKFMRSLPGEISEQMMLERDSHGNVQVSLIDTEKLLIEMVRIRLSDMKKAGTYQGNFSTITHFFGYEGRSGAPSNFDAQYAYALGYNAAASCFEWFQRLSFIGRKSDK